MATITKNVASKLVSKVNDSGKTVESIVNIICPDGKRRTMYVNGILTNNRRRGFVQVKGVSVAGYAKPTGKGGSAYKFFPHIDSINVHLVRPQALPLGTAVRIRDNDALGTITAVGWNYLTPTYNVQPLDKRRKPIVEIGADNLAIV